MSDNMGKWTFIMEKNNIFLEEEERDLHENIYKHVGTKTKTRHLQFSNVRG